MSSSEYLLGVIATAVFVAATALVASVLRRRLFPDLEQTGGAIATVVLWLTIVTAIGEGLGSGGQFARWPLIAVAVLLAVGAATIGTRRGQGLPGWRMRRLQVRPPSIAGVVTILVIGLVVGQALFAAWRVLHSGVEYSASLQHHLPNAAYFAQSHHTDRLYFDSAGTVTPYYPMNDELLHGTAMALFGRDTLTLFIGFGDIAAMLMVVWALFRNRGRIFCAAAMAGTCVLFVILGSGFEPSAGNDWHATWLLMAALLFVLRCRSADGTLAPRYGALAGLAAGQAVATKLDTLAPVIAVLIVAAVFGGRRKWHATGGCYMSAAFVAGGYWFVRDWARAGNPIPELNVSIGSWHLRRPPLPAFDATDFSVLHYLRNLHVIRHFFIPGLHGFLGPAWPVVLFVVVVGLLGGLLFPRSSTVRAMAFIGCVSGLAYLVTPTGAGGPDGSPIMFQDHVRYALPAFVIGFWILPTLFRSRRWQETCASLYVLLIGSVLLQRRGWADSLRTEGIALAAIIVVASAVVWWSLVSRAFSWELATGLAATMVIFVVAGYPAQQFYARHRYLTGASPQQRLFAALQPPTPLSVGVVGSPLEYPFFGNHWQSRVRYAGIAHGTGSISEVNSCNEWRTLITSQHFDAIVIVPFAGQPAPPALAWTASDPVADRLFAGSAGSIYLLNGPSPTKGC